MPAFTVGRVGEPSREGLGETVVDDVVELNRGVVEERLKIRGDDEDVCSDRLEKELAKLSFVLSLPSLLLATFLSLSLPSCRRASSVEASWPADTMVTLMNVDVRVYGFSSRHYWGWPLWGANQQKVGGGFAHGQRIGRACWYGIGAVQ